MEKINLSELFDNNFDCKNKVELLHSNDQPEKTKNIYDSICEQYQSSMSKTKFKEVILNYSKQLLELAADNAETKIANPRNYGHGPYNDSRIIVNKESITSVIEQIL